MDRRHNRRNKAAFSNFYGEVRTEPKTDCARDADPYLYKPSFEVGALGETLKTTYYGLETKIKCKSVKTNRKRGI